MELLNNWLEHWEPAWLFLILFLELIVGLYTGTILTVEYFYDAKVEESKRKKRKVTKDKVKIVIDANGNASITSAPKNLDIDIAHEGKE